jgi:hypothetical protein
VNPARFAPPTSAPFDQDEESSGIIDVSTILGEARSGTTGRGTDPG